MKYYYHIYSTSMRTNLYSLEITKFLILAKYVQSILPVRTSSSHMTSGEVTHVISGHVTSDSTNSSNVV
jgi:hypothetical protein